MKRNGFTLAEILIYVSVLTIVFLAVSSFLTWSIKTSAKATAIREATDNGRRSMEIMIREIREAKGIYTPTSTSTQLSLETKISTFVDFYLCGAPTSVICLKKESQNPIAITSESVTVRSLVFTQISTTTPSVRIQLGLDYKTQAKLQEYQASVDLTSTVSLRNY